MACHDVGKVAQALRRVSLRPDVDVDTASSGGVALGACVSELPAKLLQGFDVAVGQDRGDQFAFLLVRPCDGNILLEFPLAPIRIPSRPGAVPVAAGSVLVSACAEVGGASFAAFWRVMLFISTSTPMVWFFISAICLAVFSFILKSSVFLPRGCVFSLSVYTYSL